MFHIINSESFVQHHQQKLLAEAQRERLLALRDIATAPTARTPRAKGCW